jgi:hypothetical protein
MFAGIFPLEWRVPPAGFHLVPIDEVKGKHGDLPPGPVLSRRKSDRAGSPRSYTPDVEEPGLFLRFASIRPDDRDAILEFAGHYGFLGLDHTQGIGLGRASLTVCEALADWATQLVYLRHAVDVHDRLCRDDRAGLGGYVHLMVNGGQPFYWFRMPFGWDKALDRLCNPDIPPTPDPRWRPVTEPDPSVGDDPRFVARTWLDQEVNMRLAHRVEVRFGPHPLRAGDPPGFRLIPHSLLALMWLQFARSVAGNREYRVCRACGGWFELVPQDKGRKVFCGVPCKLRDYRRRRARADELKAAGRSPREIATEIETDLATVRRWLGSTRGRPNKGRK